MSIRTSRAIQDGDGPLAIQAPCQDHVVYKVNDCLRNASANGQRHVSISFVHGDGNNPVKESSAVARPRQDVLHGDGADRTDNDGAW